MGQAGDPQLLFGEIPEGSALDEEGAVLLPELPAVEAGGVGGGEAQGHRPDAAAEGADHIVQGDGVGGKYVVDHQGIPLPLRDDPGVQGGVVENAAAHKLGDVEEDQAGIVHHVTAAPEGAAAHGLGQPVPVSGAVHGDIHHAAGTHRGDLPGIYVLSTPGEAEFGIEVQHAVVGEEIDAIGVGGVLFDLRHEGPDIAPVPVLRGGHDGAQLVKALPLSADDHVRPVQRHIGDDLPVLHHGVWLIAVAPEAVLVPVFKIQPEGGFRQSVEAPPQGVIGSVVLDDLHDGDPSFCRKMSREKSRLRNSCIAQDPADAFFSQVIPIRQLGNGAALLMLPADAAVSLCQLCLVGCGVAPGPAVLRLPGDIDGLAVHILLDQFNDFLRQDLFCFYIAHVCLPNMYCIRNAMAIQSLYSVSCIATAYAAITYLVKEHSSSGAVCRDYYTAEGGKLQSRDYLGKEVGERF